MYLPHLLYFLCMMSNAPIANSQESSRSYANLKEYIAPAVLISYGLWCTNTNGFPSSKQMRAFRNEQFPHFNSSADNYLVFVPAAAVYALDYFDVKSTSNPINQTLLFAKTSALTLATVYGLKYLTKEQRPNGSNDNSFPSSHTAFAFAYATVLHEEFKDQSAWISIGGYALATTVATMRIANDAHWYNDVLVGAGIGILSTKIVYRTHHYKYKSNWPKKSAFLPNIGNQFYRMVWTHTF